MITKRLYSIREQLEQIIKEQTEKFVRLAIRPSIIYVKDWEYTPKKKVEKYNKYPAVDISCEVILDNKIIKLYYLKGAFSFDYFAIIPTYLMSEFANVHMDDHGDIESWHHPIIFKAWTEKTIPKNPHITKVSARLLMENLADLFKDEYKFIIPVDKSSGGEVLVYAVEERHYYITGENAIKFNSDLTNFMRGGFAGAASNQARIVNKFKEAIVNNKEVLDLLKGNISLEELVSKYGLRRERPHGVRYF